MEKKKQAAMDRSRTSPRQQAAMDRSNEPSPIGCDDESGTCKGQRVLLAATWIQNRPTEQWEHRRVEWRWRQEQGAPVLMEPAMEQNPVWCETRT
jgi:hypothetical protein